MSDAQASSPPEHSSPDERPGGLSRYGHTYSNPEKRKALMKELYGLTEQDFAELRAAGQASLAAHPGTMIPVPAGPWLKLKKALFDDGLEEAIEKIRESEHRYP